VTIWRHGEADSAATDRQRELTARGRAQLDTGCSQFLAACDNRSLPVPDQVLHSPWLRTTQTAEIIATALGRGPTGDCTALRPGSDMHAVDRSLAELMDSRHRPRHLVLVSHQPLVSRLVDHYLGEPGRVPALSPGGLATLSVDVAARACARLLFWALPPDYVATA